MVFPLKNYNMLDCVSSLMQGANKHLVFQLCSTLRLYKICITILYVILNIFHNFPHRLSFLTSVYLSHFQMMMKPPLADHLHQSRSRLIEFHSKRVYFLLYCLCLNTLIIYIHYLFSYLLTLLLTIISIKINLRKNRLFFSS